MSVQQEFLALMQSGGPIMWVIFLVACMALGMLIWEALKGRQLMRLAERDYQTLRGAGEVSQIKKGGSPVAQVLALLSWQQIDSQQMLAKEINIHLAEVVPKMSGTLATIAILASLLPMLGLLGTVTGMINVFEVIAIQGNGKPDLMADGISQALLTTASGLIIAIPVIFLHHLLAQRVNRLMTLTHQAIQLILHRNIEQLKQGYLHE
ncbi:MAG: MotA/TolQ/ExbB proton channel family protein [Gammaproteobacteria bacterium]|nr:MotA/TolQ/ExbB proton channel family protein [Gammaproteobacteria bacterium]